MFGTQSAWYWSDLAGIRMAPLDAKALASGWRRLWLKPAVTCEYLSAQINLSSVNASLLSSRGVVSSRWTLASCPTIPTPPAPPPPQVKTCALELEKDKFQSNTTGSVTLDCGPGATISSVKFADWGTPDGSCATGFSVNTSCSRNSTAIVEQRCVGKEKCLLSADRKMFGDICLYVPKRLAVDVACAAGPTPPPPPAAPRLPLGPRSFDWVVEIPGGSTAAVHVPLLAAEPSAVTITVDAPGVAERKTVWESGRFVGGVEGVTGAAVAGDSIALECGSGRYSFELRE